LDPFPRKHTGPVLEVLELFDADFSQEINGAVDRTRLPQAERNWQLGLRKVV
jgi:hypothetical protein